MDHHVDRRERNFVHSERKTRPRLTGPATGVIVETEVLIETGVFIETGVLTGLPPAWR
jgi:hypothetical protein